ncbi:cobalt-precorrin-5B (C(1))-methyltransferase CbiD [Humidesulfovibrio sp.]
MRKNGNSALREGFTTGSAAAAAARAATIYALTAEAPEFVDIPLPPPHPADQNRLRIAIAHVADDGMGVRAAVVKDAGDDPDATHGARIEAHVILDPAFSGVGPHVLIGGGVGVGRVTLPGLPVAVGQAAINPGPLEQIRQSVLEVLPDYFKGIALVVVEVPGGEDIARHTLNPRLGITGGISILGTGGVVRPYSHGAWAECVRRSLDVARAAGHGAVVMTTGRRSERFFQERYANAPDICLVQAADFYALSLRSAAERGFGCVVWAVFFGKLVKQAQGFENTHAREAELDFALLARWAGEAGADEAACAAILGANTAAQVLALLSGDSAGAVAGRLTALLVGRAKTAAARHLDGHMAGHLAGQVGGHSGGHSGGQASASLDVRYVVFGLDGGCLYADDISPALFSPAPPLHLGRASR